MGVLTGPLASSCITNSVWKQPMKGYSLASPPHSTRRHIAQRSIIPLNTGNYEPLFGQLAYLPGNQFVLSSLPAPVR